MKDCFYCGKRIDTVTEEFLGDVLCPNCGCMNSYYRNEGEQTAKEMGIKPKG